MNLDETSVCLFQGTSKGNVFIQKPCHLVQQVPFWKRRCCMTHVAVVCDRAEVQAVLPQVVIGNHVAFLQRDVPALRAGCPPNVILLRGRSAWNDQVSCCYIIRRIGMALAPFLHRFQPVLLLDASRVHCSRRVLRACKRAGISVVLIPAQMTGLLQPLDTHGFQRYKKYLREQYQLAKIRLASSDLAITDFLTCMYDAINVVLGGIDWSIAFDRDGYSAGQQGLSTRVTERLSIAPPLAVPSTRPSDSELALCFPRRTVVPVDLLWSTSQSVGSAVAIPVVNSAPSGSAGVGMARTVAATGTMPLTRAAARAAAVSGSSSSSSSAPAPAYLTRSHTRTLAAAASASSGGAG